MTVVFMFCSAAAPLVRTHFTSCLLFPTMFSLNMASTPMWQYLSDRGRGMLAMVWTSAFTSWAEPELERTDWDLLLTSSIWPEGGPLLIAARQGGSDHVGHQCIIKSGNQCYVQIKCSQYMEVLLESTRFKGIQSYFLKCMTRLVSRAE